MTATLLPALNAVLNALAAVLLVVGYRRIRAGHRAAHQRAMLAALVVSALFLTSYLVYHGLHGSKRFMGPEPIRTVYLAILLPHTVLAALNLPLIVMTVLRALRDQFDRHRRIAKITWVIWMFVSVSGVVIYAMNYLIWPGPPARELAFARAQTAHKAQDDETALAAYREAAADGHVAAGCFAAVIGDRLEGTATASAALAAHPEDASCATLAARAEIVAGRTEAAVAALKALAAGHPDDAFVHATLGFGLFRLYAYKEAAVAFERSAELDPSMSANVYNAGYAHFLYGNYGAARPLFQRALELGLDEELTERARRDLDVIDGALWACPMHLHVTGHSGDRCPECGMPLEPLAKGLPEAEPGDDTSEDGDGAE
jgi:putative membrane protein